MKSPFLFVVALFALMGPAYAAGLPSNQRLTVGAGAYVNDASYPFDDPRTIPSTWCGVNALPAAASALRSAYMSEKQYFQETDFYGPLAKVGFSTEGGQYLCFKYVVTLGHYNDPGKPPTPTFFVTAQLKNGTGTIFCISSVGTAGRVNQTNSGPIADALACGNLPPAIVSPKVRAH
jgi:hypothetical protein